MAPRLPNRATFSRRIFLLVYMTTTIRAYADAFAATTTRSSRRATLTSHGQRRRASKIDGDDGAFGVRASNALNGADGQLEESASTSGSDRRRFVSQLAKAVAAVSLLSPPVALAANSVADASASKTKEKEGLMSAKQVAEKLHSIPTFTIVDKEGVPYMVVGEDAKVTAYFFIEYQEAARILKSASAAAEQAIKEEEKENRNNKDPTAAIATEPLTNPWKEARISTVPLDAAVTLATKSTGGPAGGNYFRIAASEQSIEDALSVTGKKDLPEGKIPLFYYKDVDGYDPGDGSGVKYNQSPVYFDKSQLQKDYKKQSPGKPLPDIAVTELFAILKEMVKPGGGGGLNTEMQTLQFVAPADSARKEKECLKVGGKASPFQLGKRNLVL